MKKIIITTFTVLLSVSYSYASDQKSIRQVQDLVKEQTGYQTPITSQSEGDDSSATIEELLSKPLTEEAAVRIALLKSPSVKVATTSLGISEADMRQMGLLHNPTVRFSSRSSNQKDTKQDNEIEIKQDVLDLLFWPLRKRLGRTQFKVAQYQAAENITDFVKEVRLVYFQWLEAIHIRSVIENYYQAEESAMAIAQRQNEAGNINSLQLDRHKLMFQKVNVEYLRAQQAAEESLQRLHTMLGLGVNQFIMEEAKQLPDLPEEKINLADLERDAVNNRLDLMMKSQEIKSLEQNMTLTGLGVLPEIAVGYDQEREASGDKLQGVVVEGEVPLFNRNQAQHSRVTAQIEASKNELKAMEGEDLLEVRLAYQNLMTNRKIVQSYMEVLPIHQEMIKETLYEYNFMLTDVFRLLESKQAELETRKEYIDALKEYWFSRIELEHALGKKIPFKEVNVPKEKIEEQKIMSKTMRM